MKRRQFIQLAVTGSLFSGMLPTALARSKPLIVGVFPRRNPKTTFRMFTPLVNHLSSQLGIPIKLETTKNFASFWENIKTQRYDLVHFNQYHYIVANKHHGYQAVAMLEEDGRSTMAGTVTVRKDSGITTVAQLKGKKVIFGGGKRAMQSHIIPKWLLKKNGLDDSAFFSAFARNPPNALLSIYNGQADAAGCGDAVFKMQQVKDVMDTSQMHILLKSEPMAQLPWAISNHIDRTLFDRIQAALVSLKQSPEGVGVLKSAGVTGIIRAAHEDYLPALAIIREVYGDSLGVDQP